MVAWHMLVSLDRIDLVVKADIKLAWVKVCVSNVDISI